MLPNGSLPLSMEKRCNTLFHSQVRKFPHNTIVLWGEVKDKREIMTVLIWLCVSFLSSQFSTSRDFKKKKVSLVSENYTVLRRLVQLQCRNCSGCKIEHCGKSILSIRTHTVVRASVACALTLTLLQLSPSTCKGLNMDNRRYKFPVPLRSTVGKAIQ